MILIAHRGLLNGKRDGENHPEQVEYCLKHGLDVEIDVWYQEDSFWLGHDTPQYRIESEFFLKEGLWVHCKNIQAASKLKYFSFVNYFCIDKDDYTVTSNGTIWVSPTYEKPFPNAICVMPEDPRWKFSSDHLLTFSGVCSDNVYYYRDYVTDLRHRRSTNGREKIL